MLKSSAIMVAASLIAATGSAQAKEWTKVRIAMDATYPPFESLAANGEIVGFEKEIGDALCAKMKVECEFINTAWEGIIPGLNAGVYDAILSSMSITAERKEQVDFTEKVYQTPPAIAVAKDSKLAGVTDSDLSGVTIGAQTSTTHANYVQEKLKSAELKVYPSADEYKLDLTNGRIDAVIDDVVVLDQWVKSPEGACCKILAPLTPDPVINGDGAGIAIRKGEDDLREMFNKAIDEIRADGTYETINKKYFEFDVYGG